MEIQYHKTHSTPEEGLYFLPFNYSVVMLCGYLRYRQHMAQLFHLMRVKFQYEAAGNNTLASIFFKCRQVGKKCRAINYQNVF